MPNQETFFQEKHGGKTVEVLKSYDQTYAREVFTNMDDLALKHLWGALKPEEKYETKNLPTLSDPKGEGEAFLWDELLEQAREDGSLLSFFIVNERDEPRNEGLYVSPDWPSAESFAKSFIHGGRQ